MRMLEYRLDLVGQGYTVVSGDRHYENTPSRKCLPIRMYRLIEYNKPVDWLEDLVENLRFNYDLDKGTEEEYREKYANILLGKSPEWIITAFHVTVGEVFVDIYNTKTERTNYFYLETDKYGFDLRFEVPRADGGPAAVYDVRIYGVKSEAENARTTVTEYINHVRREIEFFRKAPSNERTCIEDTYIVVTEYADL